MSAKLLVDKYKPKDFPDLIGNDRIATHLQQVAVDPGSMLHYLLAGPPGCGKTSSMHVLAQKIYPEKRTRQNRVLEVNASDERGVELIRDKVRPFCERSTNQKFDAYKMVILDEADQLTMDAQQMLRMVIEEFNNKPEKKEDDGKSGKILKVPDRATRFVLACNYPEKLHPALLSRCMQMIFLPIGVDAMLSRILHVAKEEGISYDLKGINSVLDMAKGDMRKALCIVETCADLAWGSVEEGMITADRVRTVQGGIHEQTVTSGVRLLLNGNWKPAVAMLYKWRDQGFPASDIFHLIRKAFYDIEEIEDVVRSEILQLVAEVHKEMEVGGSYKWLHLDMLFMQIGSRHSPKLKAGFVIQEKLTPGVA